jgi:F420-dependent oxidoreductase-like protein
MRVSIAVTNYSWPGGREELGSELARLVRGADQAGVDTVWVADHLLQADPTAAPGDTEMLEAYTTLGFLAAQSERVRLGTMVTGVTFRPPALLVKAVTTLDVLSGGRAWLGLGAGYHGEEAAAMGLPLPPVAERFERLEETVRIAVRMWAGDESPFDGRHYRLGRPEGSPPPIQSPGPPILIGGTGERKTLRLVARYADACNLFDIPTAAAPSPTSWRSWPSTAPTSAAPTTRSRRRSAPALRPASPARRSCDAVRRPQSSASSTWSSSPPVRGRPMRWPPWPRPSPPCARWGQRSGGRRAEEPGDGRPARQGRRRRPAPARTRWDAVSPGGGRCCATASSGDRPGWTLWPRGRRAGCGGAGRGRYGRRPRGSGGGGPRWPGGPPRPCRWSTGRAGSA